MNVYLYPCHPWTTPAGSAHTLRTPLHLKTFRFGNNPFELRTWEATALKDEIFKYASLLSKGRVIQSNEYAWIGNEDAYGNKEENLLNEFVGHENDLCFVVNHVCSFNVAINHVGNVFTKVTGDFFKEAYYWSFPNNFSWNTTTIQIRKFIGLAWFLINPSTVSVTDVVEWY